MVISAGSSAALTIDAADSSGIAVAATARISAASRDKFADAGLISPILERLFGRFAGCLDFCAGRPNRRTLLCLGRIKELVGFFAAHLTRQARVIARRGASRCRRL